MSLRRLPYGLGRGLCIGGNSASDAWLAHYNIIRSGDIWYKRERNVSGGYFKLWYSSNRGASYEEKMELDLDEVDPVIDIDHEYRHRIVGTQYRVDRTITATGYAGIENTDWENIYST